MKLDKGLVHFVPNFILLKKNLLPKSADFCFDTFVIQNCVGSYFMAESFKLAKSIEKWTKRKVAFGATYLTRACTKYSNILITKSW